MRPAFAAASRQGTAIDARAARSDARPTVLIKAVHCTAETDGEPVTGLRASVFRCTSLANFQNGLISI